MNSKSIGNIGEAKVLCKFVELNIPVYVPFGDNEKADLVAEFNGKLQKIQVKTSVKAENGKMSFDLTSSTVHRKNGLKHKYTQNEIDYFALYNIERDIVLLFKVPETPINAITIRYEKPLNNQEKYINYEQDYLIENRILSKRTSKLIDGRDITDEELAKERLKLEAIKNGK